MNENFDPVTALAMLEELNKLQGMVTKAKSNLKGACTCPAEYREKKEHYDSGSYYDKASSSTWDQCTICGKHHNNKTETLPWYG